MSFLLLPSLRAAEIDPKERLARQRKLLQKKLGLDMGAAIGMDTEELFNDEDLDYSCQTSAAGSHGGRPTAGSCSRNHSVSLRAAFSWVVQKGTLKEKRAVLNVCGGPDEELLTTGGFRSVVGISLAVPGVGVVCLVGCLPPVLASVRQVSRVRGRMDPNPCSGIVSLSLKMAFLDR